MRGGSNDPHYSWVIHITTPCTSQFVAQIKVKGFDLQNNFRKTGGGPTDFFFDVSGLQTPGASISYPCP